MPQVVIPPPPDAPVYVPKASAYNMQVLLEGWDRLCIHPVDPNGLLATRFTMPDATVPDGRRVFPAGTDRNTVGRWFEDANPEFHVGTMLRIYQLPRNVEARARAWRALQPPLWKRALSYLYRALRKGR